jgi:uncharacterized membrane protein YtjA (UPF0391 family)
MLRWPIVLAMMVLISGIVSFGPLGGSFAHFAKIILLLWLIAFGVSLGFIKRGASIV